MTTNLKQSRQQTQEYETVVFQKNIYNILTYVNPFQQNNNHTRISQRHCCSDFKSVWERLPCCLSKGLPIQDFLDNYQTTLFGVCIFGNTEISYEVIFFVEIFQISYTFRKCRKKLGKLFLFLR